MVVPFIFSSILQIWYVELRISRSISESLGLRDNESRLYCKATQKMPQSRSTVFPRHLKKERWGSNHDKINATYEITSAQTKKNCNRGTALEQSVGKVSGGLTQLYTRETLPLILMHLQITNIFLVRREVLCCICETLQWNTYNKKQCDETKQRVDSLDFCCQYSHKTLIFRFYVCFVPWLWTFLSIVDLFHSREPDVLVWDSTTLS